MHVRRRIKLLRYSGLTATTRIFFLPECIYLYTLVYGMRDVRRRGRLCAASRSPRHVASHERQNNPHQRFDSPVVACSR